MHFYSGSLYLSVAAAMQSMAFAKQCAPRVQINILMHFL